MEGVSFPYDDPKWRSSMMEEVGMLLSGRIEYKPSGNEAKYEREKDAMGKALAFVQATVERFDVRGYRLIVQAWRPGLGPFPFERCEGRVQLFSPQTCVRHVGKVTRAQVSEVVQQLEADVPKFADRFVEAIDPFLDDEGMAILCTHILPVLKSHAKALDKARWQKKALHCTSPRLLQFVVAEDMYSMDFNVVAYKKSDALFYARSPLAVQMLVDEGYDVNENVADERSIVPLHSAATLQCVRAMIAAGADPQKAVAEMVPLPRACVLSWICQCVPGFALPVERILRQGRRFDYVKLLVEEQKVEIPQALIPTLSLETKWCLRALGMRVAIGSEKEPDLRWLHWRPCVHKYFASMQMRRRALTALLVFRRVAGFVPRDIRNKILIMAMN